ncbi:hypothetical protein, conserved in T. vivax [Trypanosoma vivax Y486]|uniref:Trypanosome variant surface glycoprotein A-type N-terminal domain-containing protein n=1 Tax=Trypanosoma vivax (strain Y486) TaxID=1055687 RepID=F9WSE9_TRYVY|nr:hypothetical protein, conserved in T. vivax [Trypanosoma vivax Y486]|eukprot:CCD20488.1 hypothetical protein, conserved in T. vivax [Trypanosoma vivax Y486]
MVQAIRVARFLALSAAIAAIACAHAAAQRETEHTMPQTNAGTLCDTSSKMKQLAARLAREAHTKVAAATTLRARAGALAGTDGPGGRGAAQGDAARSAVEAADAAAQKTTAIFRKALAAHGQLTHLAGQIDGWMLQLATYNGGQSGKYNVQCISTGAGQRGTAGGADKYAGTHAEAKVKARLATISSCLALPAHAPEASDALTQVTVAELEGALKADAFVVPFDGATTTGAALELKATGLAADTARTQAATFCQATHAPAKPRCSTRATAQTRSACSAGCGSPARHRTTRASSSPSQRRHPASRHTAAVPRSSARTGRTRNR